mmetsp:Transcript_18296/g.41632  ORF Transcript_18296/g.41632 Transcript_18296/m.41632 type:complete len:219 (-) Transcript_18296:368-1024(-)
MIDQLQSRVERFLRCSSSDLRPLMRVEARRRLGHPDCADKLVHFLEVAAPGQGLQCHHQHVPSVEQLLCARRALQRRYAPPHPPDGGGEGGAEEEGSVLFLVALEDEALKRLVLHEVNSHSDSLGPRGQPAPCCRHRLERLHLMHVRPDHVLCHMQGGRDREEDGLNDPCACFCTVRFLPCMLLEFRKSSLDVHARCLHVERASVSAQGSELRVHLRR